MDDKKNRQSWLDAGLQTLAGKGPAGLRIMPIAERLGVTKGSFYWHFKNLEEYQAALLAEWEQCHTQQAIDCVEQTGGTPALKLRYWFMGSVAADFMLARAIRSWALTSDTARAMQTRVDGRRIDYLTGLLQGTGWSPQDAATLAHWAYCAWIGYSTIDAPAVTAEQIGLVLAVLTPGAAAG